MRKQCEARRSNWSDARPPHRAHTQKRRSARDVREELNSMNQRIIERERERENEQQPQRVRSIG